MGVQSSGDIEQSESWLDGLFRLNRVIAESGVPLEGNLFYDHRDPSFVDRPPDPRLRPSVTDSAVSPYRTPGCSRLGSTVVIPPMRPLPPTLNSPILVSTSVPTPMSGRRSNGSRPSSPIGCHSNRATASRPFRPYVVRAISTTPFMSTGQKATISPISCTADR